MIVRRRLFALSVLPVFVALVCIASGSAAAGPSETSCQGFGSTTPGGTNGEVYHVTTLADSGPGSLRDALSKGNRIVIFDVAGDIVLLSDIRIRGAFITIDGTSAPDPGISLVNAGLLLRGSLGAHDVIVKALRIREAVADGIQVASDATNIVIENVSVNGSALRNIAVDHASDVTICGSILSSAIANNVVIKNGATRVSLHSNVLIGSSAANPTALTDDAGTPDLGTTLDMRNNVVWSWGSGFGTLVYKGATANIVANLYSDPDAALGSQDNAIIVCSGDCAETPISDGRAYVAGNVSGDNLPADLNAEGTEPVPFPAPLLAEEMAPCRLIASALADVGARPLDAIDTQSLSALAQPTVCKFDATVDSVTAPASAAVGVPFAVTDTTSNAGPGTADPTVTALYISSRATFDSDAVYLGKRSVRALAPGETSSDTTTVTIPNGIGAACNYYILAVANATSVQGETDTTNNVRAGSTTVCPDLLVESLAAPDSAVPGSTIDVVDTVRNRGKTPVGAWTLKFYLSTVTVFDAKAALIGSRTVPPLESNAMSWATTPVTLPATAGKAGTYYLLAIVDPDAVYGEYDENNNVKWAKIKIGPDLVTQGMGAPASAAAGTSITVNETTRNRGVSASPASVTEFYLSPSATLDASAALVGVRAVPALNAGATSTAVTTVAIPSTAGAAGTYYLYAVADGDNTVPEPDETNNVSYVTIKIGPDLHISAVTAPDRAVPGDTITVSDTTRNRGVGPAAASVTK